MSVAVLRRGFEVLAADGPQELIDRYDEFFAEDFEWMPALVGGVTGRTYRGREAFAEYWRDFTDAFDEIEFGEPTFTELGRERVVAVSPIHVRGAGGGVPIDLEAAYVFDFRDRRIVAGHSFFSRADAEEFAASA